MYKLVAAIVLISFAVSCSEQEQIAQQGVINYKIEYTNPDSRNPLTGMLPGRMIVKFRNHNTRTKIDGPMGFFSFEYLSDYKQGANYTLFRIIDKKYCYEADSGMVSYGYESMGKVKLEYTNETKIIAGYECQKAILICEAFNNEPKPIYYTNQIRIKNPNSNNPFKEIDGVLLDFYVRLNHINMHIVADKVVYDNISLDDFVKPTDYKAVSSNELDNILKPLFYPAFGCTTGSYEI